MTTINETPGVCGGYPCVNDTRIGVWLLVNTWRELGSFDAVCERWVWDDGLTRADVAYALSWYGNHPERVDEDIERQRVAGEMLKSSGPAP